MKKGIWIICLTLGTFYALGAGLSYATILGEIKNGRAALEEKGISLKPVYTVEYFAVTQGGLQRDDTYLSNLDLILTIDTTPLGLWDDGTFLVHILDNAGGKKLTGAIVGDTQGVSNIEAPRITRVYQLWYEHRWLEKKLSVLAGIHDFNSEFNVTDYGLLFINSSFGIGHEISKGSRSSIFPLAAPALRVKILPTDEWQVLFAAYDGDPGDPNVGRHFPRSDFDHEGGVFLVCEQGYFFDPEGLPGFFKLGVWHNTGQFNDVVRQDEGGQAIKHDGDTGGYLVVDKMLYREKEDEGLGFFLQFGSNSKDVNEVNTYVGAGIHYRGLIPGRDQDEAGIAVAHAIVNEDLVNASSGGRDDFETAIEATYKAQITDEINIQPDIQYVVNPGAATNVEDAWVFGMRFKMAL